MNHTYRAKSCRHRHSDRRSAFAVSVLAAVLIAAMSLTSFAFYQNPAGKKGILIAGQEPEQLRDLKDLGIQQAVCNIGTDQNIAAYGTLASFCKNNGITMTMIVINRAGAGELVPTSQAVEGVGAQGTYGFNVLTDSGKAAVRDYARRIAALYHDSVSNWVIGNEVNDAVAWDFNGIMDIDAHAVTYADAFRIFYEEIKNANPDARVFIPFDMRWKAAAGEGYYTVADYLPRLNSMLKDLDYGIAWHAYPVHFFTKPEFLDDDGITDDINTTPNINLKNIHLLTDYMQRPEMLSPAGTVRHLLLTEQGFTSACENGEARQAQAIRDAWAVVQANPYIEGFYLARQVDAAPQVAVGGAFGLWTRNENASADEMPASKKEAWYVYQSLN